MALALAGVLAVGGVAFAGYAVWARARPHPLLAPDAVLACPMFEVEGVPEPDGWLGAAAAHAVCLRLKVQLGRPSERVRVPAQLLELPTRPGPARMEGPYDAPAARATTLRRARLKATSWVEGKVAKRDDGFALRLRLRVGDQAYTPVVSAVAAGLDGAVARASERLWAHARGARFDPSRSLGVRSEAIELELFGRELLSALHTGHGVESGCARLRQLVVSAPHLVAANRESCRQWGIDVPSESPLEAPPLGLATIHQLNYFLRAFLGEEPERLLARLDALRDGATTPSDAALVAQAESIVHSHRGDRHRASEAILRAAALDPLQTEVWHNLPRVGSTSLREAEVRQSVAAWAPAFPPSWCGLAKSLAGGARLEAFRRCVVLGDRVPAHAMYLADELIAAGHGAEALAVGATLDALGVPHPIAEAYIRARVQAREGELSTALQTMREAYRRIPTIGGHFFLEGDGRALLFTVELALMAEGGDEVLAELVDRYVSRPAGLHRFSLYSPAQLGALCRFGPREPCRQAFDRGILGELVLVEPGTREYLEGVEHWVRDRPTEAVEAWEVAFQKGFAGVAPNTPGGEILVRRAQKRDEHRTDFAGFHWAHVAALNEWEGSAAASRARLLLTAWTGSGARPALLLRLQERIERMSE